MATKRNLLQAKSNLELAQQGHDLLDRKRQVLLIELSNINNKTKELQNELNQKLKIAERLLILAQMFMGWEAVDKISHSLEPTHIEVNTYSIMGVVIAQIQTEIKTENEVNEKSEKNEKIERRPPYNMNETVSVLDEAVISWQEVKQVMLKLAEAETTIYRLNFHLKQAQKRASALNNITIPNLKRQIKYIQEQLEEHERDELARLKISKSRLQN